MAKVSVVTPERFLEGLEYQEWFDQIKVNKDRFQQWYDDCRIKEDDVQALKDLMKLQDGPTKVLALAEEWCPDVVRGMPVIARIAEATGLDLKVFPRDRHEDIADEFLLRGEFRSIPTFVFFTRDHKYLGHWVERPEKANADMRAITDELNRTMSDSSDQEKSIARRQRTEGLWGEWQQETVLELRQLLSKS